MVLINYGLIKSAVDLFKLKNRREDILKIPGFSDKSVNKLLQSIEESKTIALSNFINAIGIPNINEQTAYRFSVEHGTWEEFVSDMTTSATQGLIVRFSANEFLTNPVNIDGISELFNNGITIIKDEVNNIKGKV